MAQPDMDFGSRAQPVQAAIPAVYLLQQPVYTVVLEQQELDTWQALLEEKLGIKRELSPELMRQGSYCLCGSTYFSEACDCDEV
jgi:hypothetical protein